jgi:hypothetical protein
MCGGGWNLFILSLMVTKDSMGNAWTWVNVALLSNLIKSLEKKDVSVPHCSTLNFDFQ